MQAAAPCIYPDIGQTTGFGYLGVDADGYIVSSNVGAARMLGVTQAALLGTPLASWTCVCDREGVVALLMAVQSGNCAAAREVRLIATGDALITVLMEATPTPGYRGGGLTFIDVGDKHLAGVIESATDAIFTRDGEGIVLSWNPAAERLFGYRADEIIGRSMLVTLPPDRANEIAAYQRRVAQGEVILQVPSQRLRRDGTLVDVELTLSPIRNHVGEITGTSVVARDITERIRTEARAREANERLSLALEAADAGDWNIDLLTHTSVRSPRHDRAFGYREPIAEWNYQVFLTHVHPQDRDRVNRAFQIAAACDGGYETEFRVIWPDGSVHWLWSKGQFYFDDSGVPVRVAGIHSDVTAKHEENAERPANAVRLELATAASQTGFWEWNLQTNAVYYSRAWKQQIGYEEHELPDEFATWQSHIHPDDYRAAVDKVTAYIDARGTASGYQSAFRLRHKDGSYRWIVARGSLLNDEFGRPERVLGSHVDITDLKVAEATAIASEQRLRAVIDASPIPFGLVDATGVIALVNDAFIQTFGYAPQDLKTLVDWRQRAYPNPGYRDWIGRRWNTLLEQSKKTGLPFDPLEVTVQCADGTQRSILASAIQLGIGHEGLYLAVMADVTEQRRLEQAVLNATSREQHRLGMDLHDGLGQELTGLSLLLAALGRVSESTDIGRLREKIRGLSAIASNCVATARAIAHGLSPIELSFGGFDEALVRLAATTTHLTGMNVTLEITGTGAFDIPKDAAEPIYRIVQEALSNSVKHGGASSAALRADMTGDLLSISIADNGRGMTPTDTSTGFGLRIMAYRARALGAQLEVDSPEAGGVIVRLSYRLREPDAPPGH